MIQNYVKRNLQKFGDLSQLLEDMKLMSLTVLKKMANI